MPAPISWPENYFTTAVFDLSRYVAKNELYGGLTQTREMAEPRWVGRFTTGPLDPTRARRWRRWWDTLRGGLYHFVAYDPLQAYPLAYPTGYVGFSGLGAVAAYPSLYSLTIGGLPGGFVISDGDLLEIRSGNRKGLHRVTAAVTATGGGLATVTVEPKILTSVFLVGSVVNLHFPSCVMVPDPASWSFTAEGSEPTSASFSGTQVLY
jgi:hypothetical protein